MTLYQHDRAAIFRFEIRGELCGSVLGELEGCWLTALPTFGPRRVILDISGVTLWDDGALVLLRRMHAAGAELEGGTLAGLIAGEPEPGHLPREAPRGTFFQRLQHWFNPRRPCRQRA